MLSIGYFALAIGCLLEGETSLITGAYMAHRGFFSISGVMLVTGITCTATDWTLFFVSRTQGYRFLSSKPKLSARISRVTTWVERYPVLLIVFYRFIYGARIAFLISIGLSTYSSIRFLLYSFLSISIWTCFYTLLGYYFGEFIEANFKRIQEFEWFIIIFITLLALVFFLLIRRKISSKLSRNRI